MAAAATTQAVHNIVKEAMDIGAGLNSLYKAFKNQLQQSVDDVQRGVSRLQVGAPQARRNAGDLRGDMRGIEQENLKVFDKQASLLALFSIGSAAWTCGSELDALESQINKGFDSVIQTVKDQEAIRAARDLKTKLSTVGTACNRMMEGVVAAAAAETQQRCLSPCARRDIESAEKSAAELYHWAESFVSSNPQAVMTKQSKLQMMPYIVAMAFATRIQVMAHSLERDVMDEECDKTTRLNRAHGIVDDFMAVLERAVERVMADTSLLEVAMVYHLPMAMYLTFITSFRASVDELLVPSAEHKETIVWDDGLAPIRDVLHWTPSDADDDQERTIELNTIAGCAWWATFTDTNPESTDISTMKTSIHIHDLCRVLGAADDQQSAHIALKPGHKSALLQLPPARELRTALCASIAHARHAAPPQNFARSAAFAPARLQAAAPRTLAGHASAVNGVAVCPDGERIVSGGADGTVRLWSLRSGQPLRISSGDSGDVLCVAATPDGKRAVSGSTDGSVRVWSAESGSIAQHILQGHSAWVRAVALSPDGRSIASGSDDKTVRLWNADTGQCQVTLTGHSDKVSCVAMSPDGETLVSGSDDRSIRVWNARTRALERSLHGHSQAVRGVAVTPDGQWLVSGSWDSTVKVWRLSSGAEEMSFAGHSDAVSCVAVFPDGQRIASGSWDKSVRVWNVRSQALEVTLKGHSSGVLSVAVSPDGRSVVSGSCDQTIKVWALSGG